MNSFFKNTDSKRIFFLTMSLILVGMIIIGSATFPQDYFTGNKGITHLTRQLIAFVIGLIAVMIIIKAFSINFFKRYSFILYILAVIFTFFTITRLGKSVNYASRWIEIKSFTIMPSDFMKIGVILLTSNILARNKEKDIGKFWYGLALFAGILALPIAIILKQPDLSTAMTIVAITFILFHLGGFTKKQFIFIAVIGVLGVIALIYFKSEGYSRSSRIAGFLNPLKYQTDEGWQISQSLSAISAGGFLGKGLGRSVQKYSYLSQAYNDYIFAIICEEIGFSGAFIVIFLFMQLVLTGIRIGDKSKKRYHKFLAIGISLAIGIQATFNMAVAVNLIPSTGLTLPFISYGGSSLIAYLIMIGLLIKISNENKEYTE